VVAADSVVGAAVAAWGAAVVVSAVVADVWGAAEAG